MVPAESARPTASTLVRLWLAIVPTMVVIPTSKQAQTIGPLSGTGVLSADTRYNFGFVLAGLGTFSNFFGAFGGAR